MSVKEARAAIDRARRQMERVQVASWDAEDREEAVTWAFYSYENCIVAAAELHGIPWKKSHPDKAAVARRLHKQGIVPTDTSGRRGVSRTWHRTAGAGLGRP